MAAVPAEEEEEEEEERTVFSTRGFDSQRSSVPVGHSRSYRCFSEAHDELKEAVGGGGRRSEVDSCCVVSFVLLALIQRLLHPSPELIWEQVPALASALSDQRGSPSEEKNAPPTMIQRVGLTLRVEGDAEIICFPAF